MISKVRFNHQQTFVNDCLCSIIVNLDMQNKGITMYFTNPNFSVSRDIELYDGSLKFYNFKNYLKHLFMYFYLKYLNAESIILSIVDAWYNLMRLTALQLGVQ